MRTIYLIRHGEPEFPNNRRFCLSQTDLPLSALGRMQGVLLGAYMSDKKVTKVFRSMQLRTKETADYLGMENFPIMRFQELGMGEWEGQTFPEIRQRYPILYKLRGEEPMSCQAPGGERPEDCCKRAEVGLYRALIRTEGDIAIVAHAGVNRLILWSLMGRQMEESFLDIPQPYGCVNILREVDGEVTVDTVALQPHPALDDALCGRLLEAAGAEEDILRHGRAVADRAEALASQAAEAGIAVDRKKLRAAALLHDIARTEPDHPAAGAALLNALRYPDIAAIIASHHDLSVEQESTVSETTLLYLADKMVRGEEQVTLEARFFNSARKLTSAEAQKAWARRYEQAQRVEQVFRSQLMRGGA